MKGCKRVGRVSRNNTNASMKGCKRVCIVKLRPPRVEPMHCSVTWSARQFLSVRDGGQGCLPETVRVISTTCDVVFARDGFRTLNPDHDSRYPAFSMLYIRLFSRLSSLAGRPNFGTFVGAFRS